MSLPISEKVAHVRGAGESRGHHCHWPGCERQVPPAKWGCLTHWFMLPAEIRTRIWRAYDIGQEETGRPSAAYLRVANEAQAWIADHHPPKAPPLKQTELPL